jgi:hypothetical protein
MLRLEKQATPEIKPASDSVAGVCGFEMPKYPSKLQAYLDRLREPKQSVASAYAYFLHVGTLHAEQKWRQMKIIHATKPWLQELIDNVHKYGAC